MGRRALLDIQPSFFLFFSGLIGFGRCQKFTVLTLTLAVKSVRVISDTQPLSTHCYLITMWTVNTYSGVARLELLDTEENIAVHLRPPYLFLSYM